MGCMAQVVWVVRHGEIGDAFFDFDAARFLLGQLGRRCEAPHAAGKAAAERISCSADAVGGEAPPAACAAASGQARARVSCPASAACCEAPRVAEGAARVSGSASGTCAADAAEGRESCGPREQGRSKAGAQSRETQEPPAKPRVSRRFSGSGDAAGGTSFSANGACSNDTHPVSAHSAAERAPGAGAAAAGACDAERRASHGGAGPGNLGNVACGKCAARYGHAVGPRWVQALPGQGARGRLTLERGCDVVRVVRAHDALAELRLLGRCP